MTCTQPEKGLAIVKFDKTELELASIEMCPQPALSPEKMYNILKYNNRQPDIICNLSFFAASTGESIWNVRSNNINYSYDGNNNPGLGIIDDKIMIGKFSEKSWNDYSTVYPLLIQNSKDVPITIAKEINYPANRTMFGWTKNQETFFIVTMDGSCKGNFAKCKEIARKYIVNLDTLVNFDGGGSTYLMVQGKRKTDTGYVRPVDNVLAIWLSNKKKGYRCQLGAFSKIENANTLLEKVKTIKSDIMDYSTAFIAKEHDGLYKVQVGFFSKKENADKVLKDLRDKGYMCYAKYVEI